MTNQDIPRSHELREQLQTERREHDLAALRCMRQASQHLRHAVNTRRAIERLEAEAR